MKSARELSSEKKGESEKQRGQEHNSLGHLLTRTKESGCTISGCYGLTSKKA